MWARVGLSTCITCTKCITCTNFAVAPAHAAFWQRRRDDGWRLLADLERLLGRHTAVGAIREMVADANAVLARIQTGPASA